MKIRFDQVLVIALLYSFNLCSQETESNKKYRAFCINYDNDFFSATDYYYTQGIRFEFIGPFIKKISINKILLGLHQSDEEHFGLTGNQECFTPTSIRRDTIFTGDRPFAGSIYLGFTRVSTNEKKGIRLSSELDLGGVGPCSTCEETQKNIHKWLVNIQPLGWQFQIRNDVAVNYSLMIEKQILDKQTVDLIAFADTKIGTLYDNFGAGIKFRMGIMENYFSSPDHSKKLKCFGFCSSEVQAVAYNATMEGGFFQENNSYVITSEKMERALVKAALGIVLTYKKIRLEYTKVYLTPEFKQGWSHSWGHCNISFYF